MNSLSDEQHHAVILNKILAEDKIILLRMENYAKRINDSNTLNNSDIKYLDKEINKEIPELIKIKDFYLLLINTNSGGKFAPVLSKLVTSIKAFLKIYLGFTQNLFTEEYKEKHLQEFMVIKSFKKIKKERKQAELNKEKTVCDRVQKDYAKDLAFIHSDIVKIKKWLEEYELNPEYIRSYKYRMKSFITDLSKRNAKLKKIAKFGNRYTRSKKDVWNNLTSDANQLQKLHCIIINRINKILIDYKTHQTKYNRSNRLNRLEGL